MIASVLGTGMVGQAIAARLDELGHQVHMGTRNPSETIARTKPNPMTGESFAQWHAAYPQVQLQAYGDLPADSAVFINATNGKSSLAALEAVGSAKLKGKTILDIANALDFSAGSPPSLFVCNTDSLGEQIQHAFPDSHVIKSLNSMNCSIMVNPQLIEGNHIVFVSGNDASAKHFVQEILVEFGWKEDQIMDLGDISTARGPEMMLPVWLRIYGKLGTGAFNFSINRK